VHGLDAPLAAGDPGEVGGIGLARVEAGDGVDDFLAGQLAVRVVAVAADPVDTGDLGKSRSPSSATQMERRTILPWPRSSSVVSGSRRPFRWKASKTARWREGWLPFRNSK